jgi:hypothetical protein
LANGVGDVEMMGDIRRVRRYKYGVDDEKLRKKKGEDNEE